MKETCCREHPEVGKANIFQELSMAAAGKRVRGRQWQEKPCKALQDRVVIFVFYSKFCRRQLEGLHQASKQATHTHTHTFLGESGFTEDID